MLDLGDFQGRANGNNNIVNLSRYGFTHSLSQNYKILDFHDKNQNFNEKNRYTSRVVNSGIFFNTKISSGLYEYSNGESQAIYSLEIGPKFVFGEFRKKLFDYTELKIFPELVIKNGVSPFLFDDFNNDSRIKLALSQQIYGPFVVGIEADYNINNNSTSYGELENKKISLGISRRAYSIYLSYLEERKEVFLGVNIFNIKNKNNSPSF